MRLEGVRERRRDGAVGVLPWLQAVDGRSQRVDGAEGQRETDER
jgi:hypothetical protein